MIPINDLKRSIPTDDEIESLSRVLRSGSYILGENVRHLESELSQLFGVTSASAVASGTDALIVALRALGVGYGDYVGTTPNSGGYTSTALRAIGALPVFIDCDAQGQMSITALEGVLSSGIPVKAVVITHLYGQMGPVEQVRSLTRDAGVFLIEDCAQSIGASREGRMAGSIGDLATLSFYPTKNLGALGDAGAVLSQSEDLASRVEKLRQYGWSTRYRSALEFGINSRMDELHAAFLRLRLPRVTENNERRRSIWARYSEAVSSKNWYLIGSPNSDFVAHLAIVVAPNQHSRELAIQQLEGRGVQTSIHYPVLDYEQEAWQGLRGESCPVAEGLSGRILTIPLFPEMSEQEIVSVTKALEELCL